MFYPKSFLKLLLIGFTCSIAPLLVAFVSANMYFGKLSKQSLSNLSQAVATTRSSRVLMEELTLMERSARQYSVLHDKLFLSNYQHAHTGFTSALQALSQQTITQVQRPQLQHLLTQEKRLFDAINQADANMIFDQNMADFFSDLTSKTTDVINKNNQLIDYSSALYKANVAKTQQWLLWQTLTLIPLAIMIAGLITWMIARPIRRMDAAIDQLGKGNYAHEISINGPGDLQQLGQRLNWLRIELKDLQQQKQRFLQQASHELKTPLTAIREASELLHDGVGGQLNAQQSEIIHILHSNSLRLQNMIENLLDYTKLQFSAAELKLSLISLKDEIAKIMQAHALSISQKKITLHQAVNHISLTSDKEKLCAIIDNLISNAVKFTPDNGEITIRATSSKSSVTIAVQDSGPGVSEQHQAGLFEPFYRGNQPEKHLVSGSGLGLFIAKEAAIALKGELILTSSERGAHFVLQIPINITH
ncbi:MAG: HAMP domain-containing histidine kinase [Bdellovibrio sp.]|nr:HAMP domain-containing histidine kinase [Methylotenera sp.]